MFSIKKKKLSLSGIIIKRIVFETQSSPNFQTFSYLVLIIIEKWFVKTRFKSANAFKKGQDTLKLALRKLGTQDWIASSIDQSRDELREEKVQAKSTRGKNGEGRKGGGDSSETAKFGERGERGAKKEHGKGKGERGKKTGKKWMR